MKNYKGEEIRLILTMIFSAIAATGAIVRLVLWLV